MKKKTLIDLYLEKQESIWDNVFRSSVLDYSLDPRPQNFVVDNQHYFKNRPIRNILFAGCGNGRNLIYFAKQGFFVIGCDISYVALQNAKKNANGVALDNFVLLKSKLEALPFPDKKFDAIICSDVIQHLVYPHQVLMQFQRVLNKDGYLLVNIMALDDPFFEMGTRVGNNSFIYKGIYMNYFDEQKAKSIIEPYFQIVDISKEHRIDPPHKGFRDCSHTHYFWIVIAKKNRA